MAGSRLTNCHGQGLRHLEGSPGRLPAPPMDEAIEEELDAFIERRIEEGGQPTDF
jgi:hypothetical protein